jgi:hypothetical protein
MKWLACLNEGIIVAFLVVMRRLCGAFLLQVFIIYNVPIMRFWHFDYILCDHFAA